MVKMVFSRAICPAFTITTNGETGILQIVQEIFCSSVTFTVCISLFWCPQTWAPTDGRHTALWVSTVLRKHAASSGSFFLYSILRWLLWVWSADYQSSGHSGVVSLAALVVPDIAFPCFHGFPLLKHPCLLPQIGITHLRYTLNRTCGAIDANTENVKYKSLLEFD